MDEGVYRHSGLDPESRGHQGGRYSEQSGESTPRSTAFSTSPLMETFAKLRGTTIICSDSQSAKLDFPIDSRLRGNDEVIVRE